MQSSSRQLLSWCLERHDRSSKSDTDKGSQRPTQRMSNDPDVRVRIQIGDVVVEVHANRIEQRILEEALLQTVLITLVSSGVATAYRCPGGPDLGAAAGEKKVVVQLVFLDGGAAVPDEPESRSSFDRNDNGAVVRRHKDVTPESIRVRLPTERIRLENRTRSA